MDTRSINDKAVNSAKGFFFLFVLAMLFVIAFYSVSNAFLYGNSSMAEEIKNDYTIESEVIRLAKNLNRYILYYGGDGFATLPDGEKVSAEDMALKKDELKLELINEELRIEEDYFRQIQDSKTYIETIEENDASNYSYTVQNSILQFDDSILQKKNEELAALREKYLISGKQLTELIIDEKNKNYSDIIYYLNTINPFGYYLTDQNSGEVYTNLPPDPSADYSHPSLYEGEALFELSDKTFDALFNGKSLASSFKEAGISGYILIPSEIRGGTLLNDSLGSISLKYNVHKNYIPAALTSAALCIVAAIYIFTRHREDVAEVWQRIFELYIYLPLSLKIIVLAFGCLYWITRIDLDYLLLIYSGDFGYFFVTLLGILTPSFLYVFMSFVYVLHISKDLRRLGSNPDIMLFIILFRSLRAVVKNTAVVFTAGTRPVKLFYAFLLLLFPFCALSFAGALFLISISYLRLSYLLILFGSLIIFFLLLIIANLVALNCKLDRHIAHICDGSTDIIPVDHKFFGSPLNRLNHLNESAKKNLDNMLNSERTKAELITNVSHDLKTPLTSIITYVTLLKKLNPQQWEQVSDYVQIIDTKAQRLKILIEDLFEAARLNSHSVELELERVDVVEILKQSLGELDEKIQSSSLSFRFSSSCEHLYLMLDGRKIWRVFENLITNILKYSQDNTRVFISVFEDESSVLISMKNTSAYEINFEAEELAERFIRGDKSRSTEGSGLGLSIAKNIIELHGGRLNISVDGDLFKVLITLNKSS